MKRSIEPFSWRVYTRTDGKKIVETGRLPASCLWRTGNALMISLDQVASGSDPVSIKTHFANAGIN